MSAHYDYPQEEDEGQIEITCKHCGQTDLSWVHTGVRWALLADDGKLHVCPPKISSPEDF